MRTTIAFIAGAATVALLDVTDARLGFWAIAGLAVPILLAAFPDSARD